MDIYSSIPFFLTMLVVAILILCLFIWRKVKGTATNMAQRDSDSTVWPLFGLLLIAIFALGAFLMYALLELGI